MVAAGLRPRKGERKGKKQLGEHVPPDPPCTLEVDGGESRTDFPDRLDCGEGRIRNLGAFFSTQKINYCPLPLN